MRLRRTEKASAGSAAFRPRLESTHSYTPADTHRPTDPPTAAARHCAATYGTAKEGRRRAAVKAAFHDTADTSDTRDFLKLFLWKAERHADILATILARMSARMSVFVSASWNASFNRPNGGRSADQPSHTAAPVTRRQAYAARWPPVNGK